MADPFELDERTRRMARKWLAEIRKKDVEEEASYKRPKPEADTDYSDDGSFWSWSDCGGDGGGDCGGH